MVVGSLWVVCLCMWVPFILLGVCGLVWPWFIACVFVLRAFVSCCVFGLGVGVGSWVLFLRIFVLLILRVVCAGVCVRVCGVVFGV